MTTARPGRWETRPGVFAFRHLILGAMQRAGATVPLHGGESRRFFRLDGFDETVYIGLLERHADRRFFAACMGAVAAKARRQLADVEAAINNLLDLAERFGAASAGPRLAEREAERASLQAQLQQLAKQQEAQQAAVSLERVRSILVEMHGALTDGGLEAKRALLSKVVHQVVMSATGAEVVYTFPLEEHP